MLAEARRVLKAGRTGDHGRPQRRHDERRTAAARQVSDPISGSPDVHHARADAPVAERRIPDSRSVHAAVPASAICREPLLLRRCRAACSGCRSRRSRHSRRRAGRYVGRVAVVGAGLPRHRARARQRGRRHGQDDHGRRLRGRLRSAHLSHSRDRGEPGDPRGHPAVLRRGPADSHARHARAASRQGVRLSARDAAGAARREPVAVGADRLRLRGGDDQVDVRAAEERRTRSRSGASGTSAARSTTCASGSTRRACGACRRRRFRRSRRSASPS